MAQSVQIECAVNSSRRAALGSIEGEIPATTAVVTSVNPEVTSIVDMEGSVRVFLQKVTVLEETIIIKYIRLMSSMAQ